MRLDRAGGAQHDDAAPAAILHGAANFLDAPEQAHHQQRVGVGEIPVGHVVEETVGRAAVVVDEDARRPQLGADRGEGAGDGGLIRQVGGQADRLGAPIPQLGGHGRAGLGIAGEQGDAAPFGGQREGGGAAQSARCAGDDGDLPIQAQVHAMSSLLAGHMGHPVP